MIAAVFVVAVVSLVVDLNTGDTTGPPYDDSLLNKFAFYTFWISLITFVGLCFGGLAQWWRDRLGAKRSE